MNDTYIYHITTASDWSMQSASDYYTHPSLDTEGFIHMAKEYQVDGVLERYFNGAINLLRLKIAVSKLTSKLIMELSTHDEYFPHLYGRINKDAIIAVEKIYQ